MPPSDLSGRAGRCGTQGRALRRGSPLFSSCSSTSAVAAAPVTPRASWIVPPPSPGGGAGSKRACGASAKPWPGAVLPAGLRRVGVAVRHGGRRARLVQRRVQQGGEMLVERHEIGPPGLGGGAAARLLLRRRGRGLVGRLGAAGLAGRSFDRVGVGRAGFRHAANMGPATGVGSREPSRPPSTL